MSKLGKGKKGRLILQKTLARCRSLGGRNGNASDPPPTPSGCFSVYVGEERERFVVRTEHLKHPLFRNLLDEAEMVYGYKCDGPLELPCDVHCFNRVLWEIMEEVQDRVPPRSPICGFGVGRIGYQPLLSPNKYSN